MMGKYYKVIVLAIFSFFLFASNSYAVSPVILYGMSGGEAETNQEYGYTTINTSNPGGWWDFCTLQPATPTETMTVSYGYSYSHSDTADNNFRMAVYENNGGVLGSQVGGCSDDGLITTGAAAWNQVSWSGNYPVLQPDTVYWICLWNDAIATYYNEADTGGTGAWDYGTGTCTDTPPNYDGTAKSNTTVSNYEAH